MRILVTGATGFIGSHTAVALQRAGHDVRVLVRKPLKLQAILQAHGATISDVVSGDVTDREAVARALQGCDGVVHAAAFVSTSKENEAEVFATNVGGTENVIGQAAELGLRHIVHVSSTTALYDPAAAALTGGEPPSSSQSPYGRSKAAAERCVRELQAAGKAVVISYPAAVIGPLDPGLTEPHRGLQIFLSRIGVVTSTGLQMVDVRDVARAHVAMLEMLDGPERIPVGGHYYRWREMMNALENLTGRWLPKAIVPGAVLRGLGKGGDLYMAVAGGFVQVNSEAMLYATRWVCTDDSKFHNLLGLEYRPHLQTMRDALLSLYRAGQLTRREIGRLADDEGTIAKGDR